MGLMLCNVLYRDTRTHVSFQHFQLLGDAAAAKELKITLSASGSCDAISRKPHSGEQRHAASFSNGDKKAPVLQVNQSTRHAMTAQSSRRPLHEWSARQLSTATTLGAKRVRTVRQRETDNQACPRGSRFLVQCNSRNAFDLNHFS